MPRKNRAKRPPAFRRENGLQCWGVVIWPNNGCSLLPDTVIPLTSLAATKSIDAAAIARLQDGLRAKTFAVRAASATRATADEDGFVSFATPGTVALLLARINCVGHRVSRARVTGRRRACEQPRLLEPTGRRREIGDAAAEPIAQAAPADKAAAAEPVRGSRSHEPVLQPERRATPEPHRTEPRRRRPQGPHCPAGDRRGRWEPKSIPPPPRTHTHTRSPDHPPQPRPSPEEPHC